MNFAMVTIPLASRSLAFTGYFEFLREYLNFLWDVPADIDDHGVTYSNREQTNKLLGVINMPNTEQEVDDRYELLEGHW